MFLIDAARDPPALFASANNVVHVGTVIFNMAVRPDNGRVYVSNTDARNEVRFEPLHHGDRRACRGTSPRAASRSSAAPPRRRTT